MTEEELAALEYLAETDEENLLLCLYEDDRYVRERMDYYARERTAKGFEKGAEQ